MTDPRGTALDWDRIERCAIARSKFVRDLTSGSGSSLPVHEQYMKMVNDLLSLSSSDAPALDDPCREKEKDEVRPCKSPFFCVLSFFLFFSYFSLIFF